MKKLVFFTLQLLAIGLYAQSPQMINYQGAVRNAAGLPVKNKAIGIRFEFRQGSVSSPTVFTEEQNVSTNSLGLFNTQIGKVNTTGISQLNWEAGDLFLTVGVDTTGGTNYTSLGSQQLVSVPYAMHAESVPATYSNSILTVGKQSFTLSSSSSTIDIQGGTNVIVGGAYPNYTVSSTPSLSLLSPNTLSISGGNTVDITPPVTYSNNVLTVGAPSNSVAISSGTSPVTPNTTITPGGLVNVSNPATNSFVVSVPEPTLSVSGNTLTVSQGTAVSTATIALPPTTSLTAGNNVSITGTAPDYTVSSTPTLNLLTANTLSISGGNSVTIAPSLSVTGNNLSVGPLTNTVSIAPAFTGSGAVTVNGAFPNYTIFATPAGSVTVQTTTVTGTNLANVTSTATNLYNVDVPAPVLTNTGNVISLSQGTAVTSVTLPVTPTYTNGAGIGITSGSIITNTSPGITPTIALTTTAAPGASVTSTGSSFSLNVPPPTFTNAGPTTITGTYPNFTVNSSAAALTGTGTGVSSVTTSGSSFTVNVPNPALSSSGNSITLTQGTVVTTASVSSSVNGSVTGGIATVTNSANNFTINVPSPALSSTGNSITLTQGTVVTTASVSSSVNGSVTGGIATVTNSANNFTVNVPSPVLSSTGNSITLTQGTVVTTASVSSSVNGSVTGGIATVTNSANNFTVNVPSPALSSTGNSITLTQGTVVTTASVSSNVNGSVTGGIATVTNSANNFTVNVPSPALSSSGNSITLTQGTVVTTASVPSTTVSSAGTGIASVTNPSTNSFVVNVPSPALSSTGNSVTLTQGTVVTTASIPAATVSPAGTGIASVTNPSTNSFVVNVPSPALSSTGNSITLTQGTVVTTASVSSSVNGSVTGGIATVTNSANNFTVNVPSPVLSSTGNSITLTQGTVVTTASVSSSVNGSVTGGIATVTNSANNFTVNVPSPALSSSGNSITLTQGTVVTTASVSSNVNGSVTGGIATVTNSANNFTVNVPSPALSSSGNSITLTQGTVVTTASVPSTTVSSSGTGIAGITNPATNSFVVNVPSPALSSTGNSITLTQGTVVTTASVSSSVNGSVTGGIATLTNTANNFTLNVPSPALSSTGNSVTLTQGTVVTTASIPATTVSPAGTGIASVTNPSTNSFVVNVPSPALSSTSNSITLTQGTVVTTATVPAAITPSIAITTTGTGAAAVTSVGSSFSINVPAPIFSNTGQNIITGTYPNFSVNTPTIANTSVALSTTAAAGPSLAVIGTNSFNINIPPAANTWSLAGNAGTTPGTNYLGTSDAQALVFKTNATEQMRISSAGLVGIGTNNPTENFQVETTGSTGMAIISNATGISSLFFGYPAFHPNGNIQYNNSTNFMNFWTGNTSRMTLDNAGNVGIGNAAPHAPLQFANSTVLRKIVLSETANNDHQIMGFGLGAANILRYQVDASTSNHVFSAGINAGSSLELMRITGTGRVGIGITNPSTTFAIGNGTTEKFNINGTEGDMNFLDDQASITFAVPTATAKPMMQMFASGSNNLDRMVISHNPSNPDWGLQYQDIGDKFNFIASGNPVLTADLGTSNVGVGTFSPTQKLDVYGYIREGFGPLASDEGWLISSPSPGLSVLRAGGRATTEMRIEQSNIAPMTFRINSSEKMRILDNGNIGIGTNSPTYKLSIFGTSASALNGPNLSFVTSQDIYPTMHMLNYTHNDVWFLFDSYYDGSFRSSTATTGNFAMAKQSSALRFKFSTGTAGAAITYTDALVIRNNGWVGIGTTNPLYQFHVEKDDAGTLAWFDNNSTTSGTGLLAQMTTAASGTGARTGVKGEVSNGTGAFMKGVEGYAGGGTQAFGVWGRGTGSATLYNIGVFGDVAGGTSPYAGYFVGNVSVLGTLSKSAGTFKIDHPLDPSNKFLIHSFVESPDMMNVYNGNTTTDNNGDATVSLPSYFQAENIDFKYQLTVIGQFAQAIILEEVSNNQFKIKTDKPNVKVSWQVTGIRNDEYAKQNRIVPEVQKEGVEKGKYLHPELYGFGKDMRLGPGVGDTNATEEQK